MNLYTVLVTMDDGSTHTENVSAIDAIEAASKVAARQSGVCVGTQVTLQFQQEQPS